MESETSLCDTFCLFLEVFGTLVACFTHERKHRAIKKYSLARLNTTSYELGCMEDITLEQLKDMQHEWYHHGLIKPHLPNDGTKRMIMEMFPGAQEILTSHTVSNGSGRMSVGDVVAARDDEGNIIVGELLLNFSMDDSCCSVMAPWKRVEDAAPNSCWAKFQIMRKPELVLSSNLDCALTFAATANKEAASVLLPTWLR